MPAPPQFENFYVAILTIVPIVLAGQFVLVRHMSRNMPKRWGINRAFEVLYHLLWAALAIMTIVWVCRS